jgi:predicted nucleic acid-binding protein
VLRWNVGLPAPRRDEIVDFLHEQATVVVQSSRPFAADVDADDSRILGEAVAGGAQVFVTGDLAIQRLSAAGTTRILSPRGFWDAVQARPSGR